MRLISYLDNHYLLLERIPVNILTNIFWLNSFDNMEIFTVSPSFNGQCLFLKAFWEIVTWRPATVPFPKASYLIPHGQIWSLHGQSHNSPITDQHPRPQEPIPGLQSASENEATPSFLLQHISSLNTKRDSERRMWTDDEGNEPLHRGEHSHGTWSQSSSPSLRLEWLVDQSFSSLF